MTEQSPEPEAGHKSAQPDGLGLQAMVIKRRRQSRNRWLLSFVCGVVVISAIGLTLFKSWHNARLETSHISRPPGLDSTPAGRQLVESPRYKQSLDIVNQRDAKAAAKQGESFVATPDEALRDVDEQPEPQPALRKPVAPANDPAADNGPQNRSQTVVVARPVAADYARIHQLANLIATQASLYQKGWQSNGSTNFIILNQDLYQSSAPHRQQLNNDRPGDARQPIMASQAYINAGQLSFARIINSTDSDTAGPVIAEIVKQGPLYKARLIGGFKENTTSNALVVEFERLVFTDGTQTPVSAYAVDASNASLGVKSAVNHRYFLRYAPLIAASFIEGLGSTLSNSGSRVLFGPHYVIATQDEPQLQQGLYAGAGKVGERMARDIEALAPKGPLVKLEAGSLIGVLFLDTVSRSRSAPGSQAETTQ